MAAFALARAVAPATAHPLRGELYYTRYLGAPNLNKIPFAFDGKAMTLGRKAPVANLLGADGLGFAADGRLIVGGQGDRVHAVRIGEPGGQQSVSAGGAKVFHVAIDPDGRRAWLTGTPGQLVEVPLEPFADGVPRPLQGDDTAISALAFDGAGRAYYTTGDDRGAGHFGTIDLKTFTTSRMIA